MIQWLWFLCKWLGLLFAFLLLATIVAIRELDQSLQNLHFSTSALQSTPPETPLIQFIERHLNAESWSYQRLANRFIISAKNFHWQFSEYQISIDDLQLDWQFLRKAFGFRSMSANLPNRLIIDSLQIQLTKDSPPTSVDNPYQTFNTTLNKVRLFETLTGFDNLKVHINQGVIKQGNNRIDVRKFIFDNQPNKHYLTIDGQLKRGHNQIAIALHAERAPNQQAWHIESQTDIKTPPTEALKPIKTSILATGQLNTRDQQLDLRLIAQLQTLNVLHAANTSTLTSHLTVIHQSNQLRFNFAQTQLNEQALAPLLFTANLNQAAVTLNKPFTVDLTLLNPIFALTQLADRQPGFNSGQLRLSSLHWPLDNPAKFELKLDSINIQSLKPTFKTQGGFDLQLRSDGSSSTVWQASSDELMIQIPQIYSRAIGVQPRLEGTLVHTDQGLIKLNNHKSQLGQNLDGFVQITLNQRLQNSNQIALIVKATNTTYQELKPYIPDQIQLASLEWIEDNIKQVDIDQFELVFQPFHADLSKRFYLQLTSDKNHFTATDDWPEMVSSKAEFSFKLFPKPSLNYRADLLRLSSQADYQASNAELSIESYTTDTAILTLSLDLPKTNQAEATLDSFKQLPIADWIDKRSFFDDLSYQGEIQGKLLVRGPLGKKPSPQANRIPLTLKLNLHLDKGQLSYQDLIVQQLNSSLTITEKTILTDITTAKVVDHQANLVIPSLQSQSEQIDNRLMRQQGQFSLNAQYLSPLLSGVTSVHFSLNTFEVNPLIDQHKPSALQLIAHSDLVGINSFLPAQFSKTATSSMPLTFTLNQLGESSDIELKLGQDLIYFNAQKRNHQWQTITLKISTTTQRQTSSATEIIAEIPVLNWNQWLQSSSKLVTKRIVNLVLPSSQSASTKSYEALYKSLQQGRLNRFKLLSQHVNLGLIELTQADLEARRIAATNQDFYISLDSSPTKGSLSLTADSVSASFSHLDLSTAKASQNQCRYQSRTGLKSLQISANEFSVGDTNFGQLYIDAKESSSHFSIPQLTLIKPKQSLTLTNYHYQFPSQPDASSNSNLTTRDLGKTQTDVAIKFDDLKTLQTLTGLELGDYQAKQVEITGNINFAGPYRCISTDNLFGNLKIKTDQGTIAGVNPGLGKLLGILNARSIVKRLTTSEQDQIDRNQLEQAGMYFESLEGDIQINNNQVILKSLRIDSPLAVIYLTGSIDTLQKNYHLQATITPEIAATYITLSSILGGPLAGLTAYFSNALLDSIFNISKTILSYDLQIAGSYDNPIINDTETPNSTNPTDSVSKP